MNTICLKDYVVQTDRLSYSLYQTKIKLISSIMEMTLIIQIGKELGLQGTALLDFIERKEKETLDRGKDKLLTKRSQTKLNRK